jgi:ketosteroid isomerase-like protein
MRDLGIGMKLALLAAFLLPGAAGAGNTSGPASAHVRQDESADAKAVLATVNALFVAFETGDAAAMLRQVYPDGRVTASGMRGDGASNLRQQPWTVFAERIKPSATFQERISDPQVHVDGDIAIVWAPFVVRIGGKVSNCGFDHFDVVRENGIWKVMNLTFSSRTTGCPAD